MVRNTLDLSLPFLGLLFCLFVWVVESPRSWDRVAPGQAVADHPSLPTPPTPLPHSMVPAILVSVPVPATATIPTDRPVVTPEEPPLPADKPVLVLRVPPVRESCWRWPIRPWPSSLHPARDQRSILKPTRPPARTSCCRSRLPPPEKDPAEGQPAGRSDRKRPSQAKSRGQDFQPPAANRKPLPAGRSRPASGTAPNPQPPAPSPESPAPSPHAPLPGRSRRPSCRNWTSWPPSRRPATRRSRRFNWFASSVRRCRGGRQGGHDARPVGQGGGPGDSAASPRHGQGGPAKFVAGPTCPHPADRRVGAGFATWKCRTGRKVPCRTWTRRPWPSAWQPLTNCCAINPSGKRGRSFSIWTVCGPGWPSPALPADATRACRAGWPNILKRLDATAMSPAQHQLISTGPIAALRQELLRHVAETVDTAAMLHHLEVTSRRVCPPTGGCWPRIAAAGAFARRGPPPARPAVATHYRNANVRSPSARNCSTAWSPSAIRNMPR